jgi:hypothetical protein
VHFEELTGEFVGLEELDVDPEIMRVFHGNTCDCIVDSTDLILPIIAAIIVPEL